MRVEGGTKERFARDQELAIELRSHTISLGSVRSDSNGAYSASVRIPNDAEAGSHRIVVLGNHRDGGRLESIAQIEVIAQASGSQRDQLPNTGWSRHLLALALGLALTGIVLVRVTGAEEDLDALAASIFGTD